MRNTRRLVIVAVIGGALLALVMLLGGGPAPQNTQNNNNSASANRQTAPGNENPFIAAVSDVTTGANEFDQMSRSEAAMQIVLRLLFAVILSGILAFRPRKDVPLFRRSLFVSQTQILLAVVAAALMMVVGDSAARAFAIFAAASLVRFRTNIRDPKEITVLLISLALGLAAGVGRWELGIALCLFALALLWLLEFNEQEMIFRAMELTVKTPNVDRTQDVLQKIFKRKRLDAEVREIDPPDKEGDIGEIVYYLNLPLSMRTDSMSDRILRADPQIEKIQWSKAKGLTDIYQ
ncbi:MAG TPA: DUF4956 domain-containing protein [Pyrinomonadaceae bacterium]|nr:DUF4956 domain-containing protein [Pyrinomonadaceae bacterium]